MDNEDYKKQAREIINELLGYSYSQIFDIAPAEQKLKDLQSLYPNSIEVLIGLMLAAIMLGNRQSALELSDKIWNIGGEISDFFELIYTDCLLNLTEVKKAGILLQSRLANIAANLEFFYMPMAKYSLLSTNLNIISQISQYPNVDELEFPLFDFANNHAFDATSKDFAAMMTVLMNEAKNNICAFDYNLVNGYFVELIFFTDLDIEQNQNLLKKIDEKINGYFLSMNRERMDDIGFKLLNIKNHLPWVADQSYCGVIIAPDEVDLAKIGLNFSIPSARSFLVKFEATSCAFSVELNKTNLFLCSVEVLSVLVSVKSTATTICRREVSEFILSTFALSTLVFRIQSGLSEADKTRALTPTQLEKAEINKQYALYTISYMQERLNNELEQRNGKALELKDLPCIEKVVDTAKANPNPMLRIAAIASLSHIARPEYKADLSTIFNLAKSDEDVRVQEAATKAEEALSNIQNANAQPAA